MRDGASTDRELGDLTVILWVVAALLAVLDSVWWFTATVFAV